MNHSIEDSCSWCDTCDIYRKQLADEIAHHLITKQSLKMSNTSCDELEKELAEQKQLNADLLKESKSSIALMNANAFLDGELKNQKELNLTIKECLKKNLGGSEVGQSVKGIVFRLIEEMAAQKEITRKTIERNLKLDTKLVEWVGLAEKMKERLGIIDSWFEFMKQDKHEKLVLHQTLESACENWDKLIQEPLDMLPIKEVLKEHDALVEKCK